MRPTIVAFIAIASFLGFSSQASATEEEKKVTICHAAGQDGTTKYVTLTISENAVYKEQGGHFFENGTPRAGHEDDYFGECEEEEETTTTTSAPEVTTTTAAPEVTTTTAVPETTAATTTVAPTSAPPTTAVVETGPPPVPPARSLPSTGSENWVMAILASILLLGGTGLSLLTRRS